jgi:hypothetical protein
MKIYRDVGNSGNILATLAIGKKYIDEWESLSLNNWMAYCERYDLGLFVLDHSVEEETGKRVDWQKLLIGSYLTNKRIEAKNICFLDVDILINPYAPNIFDKYDNNKFAVVSQINNLPFKLIEVQERIAFFRHKYFSKEYPLDSYLFAKPKKIFELHGLMPFEDYACGGLFIFNQKFHSQLLNDWYYLYDKNSNFLANAGEEVYLNYHIQDYGKVQWLPYKWQAIWPYEIAWNHNHLYLSDEVARQSISRCIETSLFNNYFLHFAGAWEKFAWMESGKIFQGISEKMFKEFQEYSKLEKSGNPVGQILPD